VAEGSDGDQVEALIEAHEPDVLLLHLTMRRCSGMEALALVRSRWPLLPVILLPMHDTRDYVFKALRSVLAGQRYLSPQVVQGRLLMWPLAGMRKP
jgi:DNA-binding NarL/FixJ family response regulator